MSLIKWNSRDFFPKLESIWDDFFSKDFFSKAIDLGTTIPAVNTKETDTAYQMELAAPGLKREDFNISLNDRILTISSEKKEEKEEKEGEKITRREFSYSSFQRSFQLPDDVKEEDISASYEDGLLKIVLPKSSTVPAAKGKKIEVK
jgi:HSP20 family protein